MAPWRTQGGRYENGCGRRMRYPSRSGTTASSRLMRPLSRTQCARKWVGQVAITAKRVCAPPSETEMWV